MLIIYPCEKALEHKRESKRSSRSSFDSADDDDLVAAAKDAESKNLQQLKSLAKQLENVMTKQSDNAKQLETVMMNQSAGINNPAMMMNSAASMLMNPAASMMMNPAASMMMNPAAG